MDSKLFEHVQDVLNQTKPIAMEKPKKSLLFKGLTKKQIKLVTTKNIFYFNHHKGLIPEAFYNNKKLSDNFWVTSTSKDANGMTYISSIEMKKYPVWST